MLKYLIPLLSLFIWPVASEESTEEPLIIFDERQTYQGDLDILLKQRVIRALVVYNPAYYFVDNFKQRGISYESLSAFETHINKKYFKGKALKAHIVFIPVSRDELLPSLEKGLGDIAVANLTITPERQKVADFSTPTVTNVKEILVTQKGSTPIKSAEELSGKTLWLRKSSSYYQSINSLNEELLKAGKPPVYVHLASEELEDADLLEMLNAGFIPAIIVDSHKAEFWADIFDQIQLHSDIAVRESGNIAWAFRKNSPKLEAELKQFLRGARKGTLFGNILFKKYLKDNKWVKRALNKQEFEKFNQVTKYIKKYATQYEFDWLMIAAQAFQESGLDQNAKSHKGAIGVMQVLPSTAKEPYINIPDIKSLDNNIHAGVKYLRYLRDRYYSDEKYTELNAMLFSFAAYNAGPARVINLRKRAQQRGLNPDIWFNNVEQIAAERIGRETVQYVSNIYKYYIAYSLMTAHNKNRTASIEQITN